MATTAAGIWGRLMGEGRQCVRLGQAWDLCPCDCGGLYGGKEREGAPRPATAG